MKPQNPHAQEDRLLDFAYGELPVPEARLVEAHLEGCSRCTQALDDIRGVRATMSQLSVEPAPDAGLESLMAYAQQAARRAAAGPEPKPSRWRRWFLPVVGLASVSTFGILTLQARSPELTRPDLSVAKVAVAKEERAAPPAADGFSPAAAAPAPAAAPMVPAEAEATGYAAREVTAPKSSKGAERSREQRRLAEDWANAGSGGGLDMRIRRESASKAKRGPPAAARAPKADMQAALEPAPMALDGAPSSLDEESEVANESKDLQTPPVDRDEASGEQERRVADSQAPWSVPPRDSLRLGSTSPAARGAAYDDELDASESKGAPGGAAAQGNAALQRPAPAPVSKKAAPPAAPPPPPMERATVAELSRQARAAFEAGEGARAAGLIRAALAAGATGKERWALLNQLCEFEFALGRRAEGLEACNRVIQEAPASDAARAARRRVERESSVNELPAKPVK
ncbi:zf-HC2 domain-containing protein [Myxococcus sp. AM010]|uniref:zf-HC2 domain-containing protein n=1 Tax=Myxococcus sp. AM010 TaxID=2745138 RepID=UPI001595F6D9|nr:zf-HC2 domain-containing protein [Myxococcus sp. AM010]NVJ18786.1 zf-HC2 domain-containing protein [Myxococcus sp. AM010]